MLNRVNEGVIVLTNDCKQKISEENEKLRAERNLNDDEGGRNNSHGEDPMNDSERGNLFARNHAINNDPCHDRKLGQRRVEEEG